MLKSARRVVQRVVPRAWREWLVRQTRRPRVGAVRFGDLRRLGPISEVWGAERGGPIDRHYIGRFLERHAGDVRGRVLEIGTNRYTLAYGRGQVTKGDVLHIAESNPHVTIIGDLSTGENLEAGAFDCVIVTQTMQCIYDVRGTVETAHRILKPGGVLLATVPGISKISRYDMDRWGHYWSFTTRSIERLLDGVFPAEQTSIEAHGNVLVATAFLYGVSAGELSAEELEHVDPDYQVLITVRARKAGTTQ